MTDINSENGHINPLELDDETISTEATLEGAEGATSSTEEATKKTKANNFKKLLAERNEAKRKAEELESKVNPGEDLKEQIKAELRAEMQEEQEKNAFINQYGESALESVQAVKDAHPTLSYEEAIEFQKIKSSGKPNPNRLSFSGNTPASLKKNKSTNELNDADLKAAMTEELKGLGFGR